MGTPGARPAPARARVAPGAAPLPRIAVLTRDAELLAVLRDSAPQVELSSATGAPELADLLLSRSCRALVLDSVLVGASIVQVVEKLAAQFPELPLVMVGVRTDEATVSRLLSTGVLYRFLHRPVSPERARSFVAAALRRSEELENAVGAPATVTGAANAAVSAGRGRAGASRAIRKPRMTLALGGIAIALALALATTARFTSRDVTDVRSARTTGAEVARTATPAPEAAPERMFAPASATAPIRALARDTEPTAASAAAAPADARTRTDGESAPAPELRALEDSTASRDDRHARANADEAMRVSATAVAPYAAESGFDLAPADPVQPQAAETLATAATAAPASTPTLAPPDAPPTPPPPAPAAPLRKLVDASPAYPSRARARKVEGWVDVAFTVGTSGTPENVRVMAGQPQGVFDSAAIEAVRTWRYAAPPAPQDANVRVRFRLDR